MRKWPVLLLFLLSLSLVSAGWFSFLDKIWNPEPVVPVYSSDSLSNNAGLASAEGKFCNHDWECYSGYCTGSGDDPDCTRDKNDNHRKCRTVDLKVPVSLAFQYQIPDGRRTPWTWDDVPIKSGETVTITNNGDLFCDNPCTAYEDWAVTGWYLDEVRIGTSVLTRAHFDSRCLTQLTYTFNVAPGTHTLKFVLDDKNDLKENDEDNNVIVRRLLVSGGCIPLCSGKSCGADDGCSGRCQTGSCPSGKSCRAGVCSSSSCTPTCPSTGLCGISDGCNGKCQGYCPSGQSCQNGACVTTNPANPSSCVSMSGTCQWASTCPSGGQVSGGKGAYGCAGKYCCVQKGTKLSDLKSVNLERAKQKVRDVYKEVFSRDACPSLVDREASIMMNRGGPDNVDAVNILRDAFRNNPANYAHTSVGDGC